MKQEAEHAKRGSPERAEPQRTNGVAEPRPIDILELLSKAKEEYQRVRSPASTPGQRVQSLQQKHAAGRATCEKKTFYICVSQTKTGEADKTAEHMVRPAEHAVVHSAPQPEKVRRDYEEIMKLYF